MSDAWRQWEGQEVDRALVLGRYLGGSDRSAVFLTEYGRPQPVQAAVKLIPVDPQSAAAHQSRLEAVAKLSHPSLLRLLQSGVWQKNDLCLLYVVMEYAPENLSQVLRLRPLTPDEAREVLGSAIDALAYLHSEGFAHGHLKPSNILAIDDRVKLSSDSLSRPGDPGADFLEAGAYDPPEAARGEVTPAGDVWGLAVNMVQMLTQQLPVDDGARNRQALPETLPEPFLEIASRCLRPDPRSRLSLDAVQARLLPEAAPLPRPPRRPAPGMARRFALPLAAFALLLATILVIPRWRRRPAPPVVSSPPVRPAPVVATPKPPAPKPAIPARPKSVPKRVAGQERPSPFGSRPPKKGSAPPAAGEGARSAEAPPASPPQAGVVRQVLPDVPAKAQDTIQGKVDVEVAVEVDLAGNVIDSNLRSPSSSRYFADLAMQAARGWKFVPASGTDPGASGTWDLRFQFRRTGTVVRATRRSPQ